MAHGYAKDQPAGFTNRISRIAIVGAGGQLGKHIVPELLKSKEHTITALTRRVGGTVSSTSSLPAGLRVAEVDYDDEASLVAALSGQDCLIITLSVLAPPATHSLLARAAAKAGVPWVLPNTYGFDFANESLARESIIGSAYVEHCREIEALGVSSWVAVVCGLWYEYSVGLGPNAFGLDLDAKKLTLFGDGNTRMNVSTFPQIARAVAALVALKVLPEHEGDGAPTLSMFRDRPVYVSSFLLSQTDVFESWKRVTGQTDSEWTAESVSVKERWERGCERMRNGDLSGAVQAMFARQWFPGGGGDFESTHGLANGLLGLPSEDLDEWTREAQRMFHDGYGTWVHGRLAGGGGNSGLNQATGAPGA